MKNLWQQNARLMTSSAMKWRILYNNKRDFGHENNETAKNNKLEINSIALFCLVHKFVGLIVVSPVSESQMME